MKLAATIGMGLLLALPARADPLDHLSWLSGCWRQSVNGRSIEEVWMRPAGSSLMGVGRTIRVSDNSLRNYEFMKIDQTNGQLAFTALPSGQAGARFVARSVTGEEVVFENPENDFPQTIVYRRTAEGLHAHIEGRMGETVRRIDFEYRRCE